MGATVSAHEDMDRMALASTVFFMGPSFSKVFKANGYCRTAGVAAASHAGETLWLPVEKVAKAKVRAWQGTEGDWSSASHPDLASQAHTLWLACGLDPNVHVQVLFELGHEAYTGLLRERAAVIAAVMAAARALEEPVHPATISSGEEALGSRTGLAFGQPVIGGEQVLETPRYAWLWARPSKDVHISGEFGPEDMHSFPRDFFAHNDLAQQLKEAVDRAGLKPVAVVGGHGPGHPAAALVERSEQAHSALMLAGNYARAHLETGWTVGQALSAVPTP